MQQIDIYKVLEDKNPRMARRVPRFVMEWLRRILHQDELNDILTRFSDLEGIEFIKASLAHMGIRYRAVGMDNLDERGRYVFASNHPFGGLDGLMLAVEVAEKFGDVRVVVNDLLMNIDPIKGLFVPVNKHGRQNSGSVEAFNDAFTSDIPIITFPAGLCSRKTDGEIKDPEWKPNFMRKAAASDRQIVPVFFDGVLSNRFYRIANVRKKLKVKVNIEMLYLSDEMFRQRGSEFEIIIGAPLDPKKLLETMSLRQATDTVRQRVYQLRKP